MWVLLVVAKCRSFQLGSSQLALGFVICFSLIGCQRGDLGLVNGRVTLDGEPLENAFVEYSPVSIGSVATGRTDANGEYFLMYSRTVKGAALGENVVRITTHDILDVDGREVPVPEKVPSKYNSRTELSVMVESGRNQFDFDLDSKGEKINQPKILEGS